MKMIMAIIRPEKLEAIKNALLEADITGMTISQVQGCGKQHGWKEYFRGTEVLLNMVPKVKVEIVAEDKATQSLIDVIVAQAHTGEIGDGKVFVYPIDQTVRIRTGETGKDALV